MSAELLNDLRIVAHPPIKLSTGDNNGPRIPIRDHSLGQGPLTYTENIFPNMHHAFTNLLRTSDGSVWYTAYTYQELSEWIDISYNTQHLRRKWQHNGYFIADLHVRCIDLRLLRTHPSHQAKIDQLINCDTDEEWNPKATSRSGWIQEPMAQHQRVDPVLDVIASTHSHLMLVCPWVSTMLTDVGDPSVVILCRSGGLWLSVGTWTGPREHPSNIRQTPPFNTYQRLAILRHHILIRPGAEGPDNRLFPGHSCHDTVHEDVGDAFLREDMSSCNTTRECENPPRNDQKKVSYLLRHKPQDPSKPEADGLSIWSQPQNSVTHIPKEGFFHENKPLPSHFPAKPHHHDFGPVDRSFGHVRLELAFGLATMAKNSSAHPKHAADDGWPEARLHSI